MTSKICKTVSDIMIRNITTLHEEQSVFEARKLMTDFQFRNVPVVGEEQQFIGIVTQKSVLREALRVNGIYGASQLDDRLTKISLSSIVESDGNILSEDMTVIEAGELLLSTRAVSLPVVKDGRLTGILSVSEYVTLVIDMHRNND